MSTKTDPRGVAEPEAPTREALLSRRQFLSKLTLILGAIGTALLGLPVIGFLFAPLVRKPPEIWRNIGAKDDFKIGETVKITFLSASPLPWSGIASNTAAWLRRINEDEFIAFAVNCTHLGCPVRWLPDADLFMCPCHGGVFYGDGTVAAGPPTAPLIQYDIRVAAGQVEIRAGEIPITTH